MTPVAALLLPLAALALAGSTVSMPPADRGRATIRSTPSPSNASYHPAPSADSTPSAARTSSSPALRDRWTWPLRPRPAVIRPFARPATAYGVGHRGVDLAGTSCQDVLAVSDGTVTHVGRIAGRGTVTVQHASGVRSTYEPVRGVVASGAAVARGAVLGRLEGSGSHCGARTCLHLGAVGGETYLDPVLFLLGGQRVRLLPMGHAPEG